MDQPVTGNIDRLVPGVVKAEVVRPMLMMSLKGGKRSQWSERARKVNRTLKSQELERVVDVAGLRRGRKPYPTKGGLPFRRRFTRVLNKSTTAAEILKKGKFRTYGGGSMPIGRAIKNTTGEKGSSWKDHYVEGEFTGCRILECRSWGGSTPQSLPGETFLEDGLEKGESP